MALTVNGIGTTFYGQRDFRADGSYLTTRWFVFFFIPLLPIESLRVREIHVPSSVSRERYLVLEIAAVSLKQVVSVYLLLFGYLIYAFILVRGSIALGMFSGGEARTRIACVLLIVLGALLPAIVVGGLIKRSRRETIARLRSSA